MVHPKFTLSMLLFTFALGGWIILFDLDFSSKSHRQGSQLVFSLEAGEITEMEIQSPEKNFLFTRITAEKWMVKDLLSKVEDEADIKVVGELLAATSQLAFKESQDLNKEPLPLEKLGFSSSSMVLTLRAGHQEERVYFGHEIPNLSTLFIRLESQNKVYTVAPHFQEIWKKDFFIYREKHLSMLSIYDIDYFFMKKENEIFEFRKKDQRWYFTSYPIWKGMLEGGKNLEEEVFQGIPLWKLLSLQEESQLFPVFLPSLLGNWVTSQIHVYEPVPESNIRGFLFHISQIQATHLMEATRKNVEKLELNPERATLRMGFFKGNSLEKVILLWKKEDNKFYSFLKTQSRNVILELGKKMSVFDRKAEDFWSPSVFSIPSGQVQKWKISFQGKEFTFARKKEKWALEKDPNYPLDEERMEEFLQKILKLEKIKFLSMEQRFYLPQTLSPSKKTWQEEVKKFPRYPSRLGLEHPAFQIQVDFKNAEKQDSVILKAGKKEGDFYIGWTGRGPLFYIKLTSLEEFWEKDLLALRERKIFISLSECEKIELSKGIRKVILVRKKNTSVEDFVLPEKNENLQERIDEFMDSLRNLKAESFFSRKEKKEPLGIIEVLSAKKKKNLFIFRLSSDKMTLWEEGQPYEMKVNPRFVETFLKCFP